MQTTTYALAEAIGLSVVRYLYPPQAIDPQSGREYPPDAGDLVRAGQFSIAPEAGDILMRAAADEGQQRTDYGFLIQGPNSRQCILAKAGSGYLLAFAQGQGNWRR